MKRKYSKPEIIFEDFSLNTNVASNCEGIVDNPTKGTCAVLGTGNIAVFSDTMTSCDFKPTDVGGTKDDEWDGFCYHVPTDYANLFNS